MPKATVLPVELPERRLGLRIDNATFERLFLAMPHLKIEARKHGQKVTQQSFVEEAINAKLDEWEKGRRVKS